MKQSLYPTKLMEDHRDAYFFWCELGVSDLVCVHVDAHLDVSDLKTPGCEISHSPEINCGNYLLPAIREGIVSSLIWVIPEHLPGGQGLLDWSREELQNWLHMDLAEFMTLKETEERVEGTLVGKPFTVCTSKAIPKIEQPVLLDIDVDYYIGSTDEIWQAPAVLAEHLEQLEIAALTIAYSVQGGYTPVHQRYLGPLTKLFLADPERGAQIWAGLQNNAASLPGDWPDWTKPAQLALAGDLESATALEPGYLVPPIDHVSAALMRRRFEKARCHLRDVVSDTEKQFMLGMIASREKRFDEAADIWMKLLADEPLEPRTLLFLLTLCGRVLQEARRFQEAFDTLQKAAKVDNRDSEVHFLLARASVSLEQHAQAAKLYRKAIKLAPNRLETAEIKLELAELYIGMGQFGLADRLLQQTLTSNTPGFMKLRAEALRIKIALGMSV